MFLDLQSWGITALWWRKLIVSIFFFSFLRCYCFIISWIQIFMVYLFFVFRFITITLYVSFCTSGAVIGDDLPGCTFIGCNNIIGQYAVIGTKSQDLKYAVSFQIIIFGLIFHGWWMDWENQLWHLSSHKHSHAFLVVSMVNVIGKPVYRIWKRIAFHNSVMSCLSGYLFLHLCGK